MPWWGWVIFGASLMMLEMFVIDAQFYLVFFGVAATLVGLIGLAGAEFPAWIQWLAFGLLSLVAMLAFRRRIYEKIRRVDGEVEQPVRAGDRVTLPAALAPGQNCRVDYRGSSWSARNADSITLEGEAEIARIEGLTLHLRRAAA